MPTVQELLDFLESNNHIGSNNAIIAKEIAEHFGISDNGVEVPTRNIIREAIQEGELIGSSNQGFYIIDNLGEFEDYMNSLGRRSEKILHRRRNMIRNWNSQANEENSTQLPDLFVTEN